MTYSRKTGLLFSNEEVGELVGLIAPLDEINRVSKFDNSLSFGAKQNALGAKQNALGRLFVYTTKLVRKAKTWVQRKCKITRIDIITRSHKIITLQWIISN